MYRLLVGLLVLGVTVGFAWSDDKPKDKAADKTKTGLDVGDRLPDLVSKNLEDKTVKVSDLKGKVVVVDVWATWCGPCRAMIPHSRELVKKMKDKPFVLVSISIDAKKDALTNFLAKEKMPWTHWWDGQGGNVSKTLKIESIPTIYVLDAKGVIRFKDVREKKMDEAVEKLLKELKASKQTS